MVQRGLVFPLDCLILVCKGIFCVKWPGHHILHHCVSFKCVRNWITLELCIRGRIFIIGQQYHNYGQQSNRKTSALLLLSVLATSAFLITFNSAQVNTQKNTYVWASFLKISQVDLSTVVFQTTVWELLAFVFILFMLLKHMENIILHLVCLLIMLHN